MTITGKVRAAAATGFASECGDPLNSSLSLSLCLRRPRAGVVLFGLVCVILSAANAREGRAADERDYYRLIPITESRASTESRAKRWRPAPKDLVLEVSGLAPMTDGRLAVSIRKGEVWLLDHVYEDPPLNVTYKRYATALHEPLGLVQRGKSFFTVQRSELTELRDVDGDDEADEYLTVAKGWTVTGNYHEYAFGPKLDGEGNLWLTLNSGLGLKGVQQTRVPAAPDPPSFAKPQGRWRGWGLKIGPDGETSAVCAGFRSPAGLGMNAAGDMFASDQQGNWIPAGSLHHMRPGAFFGYPDSLYSMNAPGSQVKDIDQIPAGTDYPTAVRNLPALKPPAVWFPYKKMGQSATDIVVDSSDGEFGPFAGQLFVGEFTLSAIHRVFLEQVGGEYQGACFPFRDGFPCAVLRMSFGIDGSMFVGLTNRGWSSVGAAAYGLYRVKWTGQVPFEVQEMRARPDGFELLFTRPVDASTAANLESYSLESYTYHYHSTYGSDEIKRERLTIRSAEVSEDGRRVRLRVEGLRAMYVHELRCDGVRNTNGEPLLHSDAYYTLNQIPRE